MRVLDGTERKLCCHRAAAHNGVVRQRFDSLFNSVTHRDLSVLGMVGISLRRRRLLRAGPRCPISLGKPWANERALEGRRPPRPCFFWLRGLDLNQRPLGYEYKTAMTGNPLILQERRSAASGSTLSDDASFFVSFHPVSGCYGSKMGAEMRAQSPRPSAASGAGDLATAILVPVRPLRS